MTKPQPSPPRQPRRKPKTWERWGLLDHGDLVAVYMIEPVGDFPIGYELRRVTIRLAPTRRRRRA